MPVFKLKTADGLFLAQDTSRVKGTFNNSRADKYRLTYLEDEAAKFWEEDAEAHCALVQRQFNMYRTTPVELTVVPC